jgi:hypothetical protein
MPYRTNRPWGMLAAIGSHGRELAPQQTVAEAIVERAHGPLLIGRRG